MEVILSTFGEQHPNYATGLSNLAGLYEAMGDYTRAEALYLRALQIERQVLGEQHPGYATSLNNLAELYRVKKDYVRAEPLFQQTLEILQRTRGDQHPNFVSALNNLAMVYEAMEDYTQAESFYERTLTIRRQILGERHPDYAASLNNLAVLYWSRGDFVQAKLLHEQALSIRRQALGERHPLVAQSLYNLAILYGTTGNYSQAEPLVQDALTIENQMIDQVFSRGSERQRIAYVAKLTASFDTFLGLVSRHLGAKLETLQAAQDWVLRRKGIGMEALAAQRDLVLGGQYPHLAGSMHKLAVLRGQLARKILAGSGPEGLEQHLQILAEWEARKEELEAQLAQQIPEMRLEQQLRAASREAVANQLPDGSALVEFVRFNVFDFQAIPAHGDRPWKPARYAAFILHAGDPDNVQMLDLGEADAMGQRIDAFREVITGRRRARAAQEAEEEPGIQVELEEGSVLSTVRRQAIIEASRDLGAAPEEADQELSLKEALEVGQTLRAALFDPLHPALKGSTRLFLAPDGDLTRLPLEVLPTDDGHYLLDSYQISYLGVGRDILRFGTAPTRQASAPLVAADPDFNLAAPADTIGSFRRLHGTGEEGELVAGLLGVQPLMQDEAVESHIKGTRSPCILHLATHGFFLPDVLHDPNEELLDVGMVGEDRGRDGLGRLTGRRFENPLLRSGLALAGANTWLSNQEDRLPPEAEDGLLTAEDVSGMDLLDTELVVLSACETGLGEIHVGEGVFGLRRAFVVAGARTLVMSLWKVPDEATRELMTEFYRRLLQGAGRAEALRGAQLWMKERHPHPRDWGAFICQGDPAPLPVNAASQH